VALVAGWLPGTPAASARYEKAGIKVINTETNETLKFSAD
jgi:hypothetical protein